MPLPNSNIAWPPANIEAIRADITEADTWYAGDPERLRNLYESSRGGATTVRTRPSQWASGVKGRLARFWWGVPTASGEQPVKLHVPLPADLCATSADLLFSEAPKLTSESESMSEFLDGLEDDGLVTAFQEAAELGAAHGGVYLRNVWNQDVNPDRPWTDVVHADMAVPVFRWGRLAEVTFWQQLTSNDHTVYRLLEHHEPGFIEHALFEGTADNLGTRVPLAEHPEAAHLADAVDSDSRQATGITRLTAQYVPNMLPNRLHRGSRQGRSDLSGLMPMFDALDEAFSSWQRDIRHAKSRIHVPAQYLESMGPGEGAIADTDREVYVPVQGVLGGSDALMIEAQQFKIRVDEHQATVTDWTKRIIESAGYSTQSLSSDTGGAVTAAEVHSHERRSYMTRGKKIRYWTPAMIEHLSVQAELANVNLAAGLDIDTVRVEFEDGVQDTALNIGQTAMTLYNAQAASADTRVRMLHPDWDDKAVEAEVAAILSEFGSGAPLPLPDDAGF